MDFPLFKREFVTNSGERKIKVRGQWIEDRRSPRLVKITHATESFIGHSYAISMIPIGLCWRSYDFMERNVVNHVLKRS